MKLYERYADEISDLIRAEVLRPGERLPSVRQAKVQRGVSASTVFEAYALLEARGLVVCRPRSGFYVAAAQRSRAPEPATATPAKRASAVAISDLVFEVLGATRDPALAPLGSAFPSPHFFPLDKLARHLTPAMRQLPPEQLTEHLTLGDATLQRQIALRYARAGIRVEPAELVMTNGAMEALNLCLQVVAQPGDVVVVESPAFYAALQALERLQLRAVEVATHPRWGVDLQSLAEVFAREPVKACWLMPNFQNPLGSLMPLENKRALAALLAQYQVPLIEDDVYGELYYGLNRPPPVKAFDREGLVLHCSSFSKCLAPGYRVGWVSAGRFSGPVQRMKLTTSLATATPSQLALASYLQTGGFDRHLRHMRHALEENATLALRCIGRAFPKGTKATRPLGGYFLWLELPRAVNALALQRQALAQGLSLAPGPLFSADGRFAHHLRVNYGFTDPAKLQHALTALGALARRACTHPGEFSV